MIDSISYFIPWNITNIRTSRVGFGRKNCSGVVAADSFNSRHDFRLRLKSTESPSRKLNCKSKACLLLLLLVSAPPMNVVIVWQRYHHPWLPGAGDLDKRSFNQLFMRMTRLGEPRPAISESGFLNRDIWCSGITAIVKSYFGKHLLFYKDTE